MTSLTTELKVGIFVILAIAAASYMTFMTGKTEWGHKTGYSLYTNFSDIAGLDVKTKVKIAGVDVGTIEEISLEGDKAKLRLHIMPGVVIREDAVASIRATGLMGDKIVDIRPGQSGRRLKDGDIIATVRESQSVDELAAKMSNLAGSLETLVGDLNNMFASEETKRSVFTILKNVADMTQELKGILSKNDDLFGETIRSINKLSASVNSLFTDEKGDVIAAIKNIKEVSEQLRLITEKNGPKIGELTQSVTSSLNTADSIMKKIDEGHGTIGKVVNDEELYNSVLKTAKTVEKIADKINTLRTHIELKGDYLAAQQGVRGQFNLTIMPNPEKYYILGVVSDPVARVSTLQKYVTVNGAPYNISETQTQSQLVFNALFARRYSDTILRFGMIESTVGFGADQYLFNQSFKLSADIWDFSSTEARSVRPHVNLTANFFPLKGVFVSAGGDNILNPALGGVFIGAGLYFEDNDLKYLFGVIPSVSFR